MQSLLFYLLSDNVSCHIQLAQKHPYYSHANVFISVEFQMIHPGFASWSHERSVKPRLLRSVEVDGGPSV